MIRNIMKIFILALFFVGSIANGLDLGEDIEVDELSITGKTMDEVKEKAVKKALEKALHEFGIKEGPIYKKIFSQYNKDKYVDETTVNYKERNSNGYKAVLSFKINGQELFNTLNNAIKHTIKKEVGDAKFIVGFLMKSDINLYDTKSARRIADQNNKTLNSSVMETLRSLKIRIKDDDRARTIINNITSESTKLSTAQAVNNLRDDLKKLAKKKKIPYLIFGVVNIINKKEIRGKTILTVAVNGGLIDIKKDNLIPIEDTIKVIDRSLSDAIITASHKVAKNTLLTKGLVAFLNSFTGEIQSKRVDFYICYSKKYEDDFDDFKDDVLDFLEDNLGKIVDEEEKEGAYYRATVNVDFDSIPKANNIRRLRKLIVKGLENDYETVNVKRKKNSIGIALLKNEQCVKKVVKNSSGDSLVTVKAEGYGDSIEFARKSALQAALEQVMGANIKSSTLVKNGALLSDNINSVTAGLVKSYKVLKTKKEGRKDFEVVIKATINKNATEPEGIKDFIKDRKSMQTFIQFNFKDQSLFVDYISKKLAKKFISDDLSDYISKNSSVANVIKSKVRGYLREKGFKIVNKKTKSKTVIYLYATGEVSKDGNNFNASVRTLITGKSKKGLYFADTEAEAQAMSETPKDALMQAGKKVGDIVAEKLLINIVKNFIIQRN